MSVNAQVAMALLGAYGVAARFNLIKEIYF